MRVVPEVGVDAVDIGLFSKYHVRNEICHRARSRENVANYLVFHFLSDRTRNGYSLFPGKGDWT